MPIRDESWPQVTYELTVFLVLAAGALIFAAAAGGNLPRWYPAQLLVVAVVARIVGAAVRYQVLFGYYGTGADAARYYRDGMLRAEAIWAFELMPWNLDYWEGIAGRSGGTTFVMQLSGLVLSVIGDSLLGGFLVFSLAGFVGIYALIHAYGDTHDATQAVLFAAFASLWPSLWFWPSSLGKEALLLLAIGMATAGYVRARERNGWPLLLAGVGLAFLLRPHVAVLLVAATFVATVAAPGRSRSRGRLLVELALGAVVAAIAVRNVQVRFGIVDIDVETVREFVALIGEQTRQGRSVVALPTGPTAPLQAFVNVWARPFPWEAHNATARLASAEVMALWLLAWFRRRELWAAIRRWRHDDALRFGFPLMLSYTIMIGLSFANLGIIARQRAPMMLIFLMVLSGAYASDVAGVRRRLAARREARRSPPSGVAVTIR